MNCWWESGGQHKGMAESTRCRNSFDAGDFPGKAFQVKGSSSGIAVLLAGFWAIYIPTSKGVSCGDPMRGQQLDEE